MNKDIRVATSFLTHRKRKKLQRALGAEGVLAFLDLLLSVAICRPDGVLSGMDKEDIALDAQWDGDEDAFVDTLVGIGFLEVEEDGTYVIHNWIEHNEYAAGAAVRSQRATKAAKKRWSGKQDDSSKEKVAVPGDATSCQGHAAGNAQPETSAKTGKNTPKKQTIITVG